MSKNKKFIITFLLLFMLGGVVSLVFFLGSENNELETKRLLLEKSLAVEAEHKEALEDARLWCDVSKGKISKIKRNLKKGLNKLDKNAEDYLSQKENYQNKLNNINNAQYWEKCENNFQSQLDASNIRIDIIKNKIRTMKEEFD